MPAIGNGFYSEQVLANTGREAETRTAITYSGAFFALNLTHTQLLTTSDKSGEHEPATINGCGEGVNPTKQTYRVTFREVDISLFCIVRKILKFFGNSGRPQGVERDRRSSGGEGLKDVEAYCAV